MEKKYIQFLNFPWNTSEDWRMYFNNLSEIPKTRELAMHFRKRYYQLRVDSEFDVKYDPNAEIEIPTQQKKSKSQKGVVDTLLASIEGFIWVAYFFNILVRNNILKLCLISTIMRFFRNKYDPFTGIKSLLPEFNKEFLNKILKDEYLQLLLYIHTMIISDQNISYLLLFPISITAVYCICDYFSNYLRVFLFFKKYFESVTNKKKEIDSIKAFSFV